MASFEPASAPAISRSVFFEIELDTLAPSRSAMALASSRVIFCSAPVKTTVLPATGLPLFTASIGSDAHLGQQRVERPLVMRLDEEIRHRLGDDVANAVDIVDPLARLAVRRGVARGLAQIFESLERPRQPDGVGLADMAYAERENETIEHDFAPRFNRLEQFLGRDLAEALEIFNARQTLLVAPVPA